MLLLALSPLPPLLASLLPPPQASISVPSSFAFAFGHRGTLFCHLCTSCAKCSVYLLSGTRKFLLKSMNYKTNIKITVIIDSTQTWSSQKHQWQHLIAQLSIFTLHFGIVFSSIPYFIFCYQSTSWLTNTPPLKQSMCYLLH